MLQIIFAENEFLTKEPWEYPKFGIQSPIWIQQMLPNILLSLMEMIPKLIRLHSTHSLTQRFFISRKIQVAISHQTAINFQSSVRIQGFNLRSKFSGIGTKPSNFEC